MDEEFCSLGPWSLVLQPQTPLSWLRCPPMRQYILKFRVETPHETADGVRLGVVLHAEHGRDGLDGVTIWMEVREGRRVYCVGGRGLASVPVVSREYPVEADGVSERWEVQVLGDVGYVYVMDHHVRINFRASRDCGSVALFNTSDCEASFMGITGQYRKLDTLGTTQSATFPRLSQSCSATALSTASPTSSNSKKR